MLDFENIKDMFNESYSKNELFISAIYNITWQENEKLLKIITPWDVPGRKISR